MRDAGRYRPPQTGELAITPDQQSGAFVVAREGGGLIRALTEAKLRPDVDVSHRIVGGQLRPRPVTVLSLVIVSLRPNEFHNARTAPDEKLRRALVR